MDKEKQRKLNVYQRILRDRPTLGEQIFIEKCQYFGINYIFQKGFISKNIFCIADFFLPKYKIIVEIDGKYHETKKQRRRDYFKDKFYKSINYKVLRIKEEDVESFVFRFDPPKQIYTMEQYKNLKMKKQESKIKKEKLKRLKMLRNKYPYS